LHCDNFASPLAADQSHTFRSFTLQYLGVPFVNSSRFNCNLGGTVKISLLLIALVVLPPSLAAQLRPGRVEVSFSGSYQNYASDGGTSSSAIMVSPRVGFFPFEGLEAEPEVVFLPRPQGTLCT
jgi:hypothetical protein